jgi:hypothetical protein
MMRTTIVAGLALVMATGAAHAEKAPAKGAANAAEMWIRYLGPAADQAAAKKATADHLTIAIFDEDNTDHACNGSFEAAAIDKALECLGSSQHFALLEFDFEAWHKADLASLPPLLAKEKDAIAAAAKSTRLMIHSYEESGMHEVVIVALVKGKRGKAAVQSVWKAGWNGGGGDDAP